MRQDTPIAVAPGSERFRARSVIVITMFVIVWDAIVTSLWSSVLGARDVLHYRLLRGTYNTVMYRWRWKVEEKVRLMLGRKR